MAYYTTLLWKCAKFNSLINYLHVSNNNKSQQQKKIEREIMAAAHTI